MPERLFDSAERRRALLTILGGLALAGSLALDDVAPDVVGVAVVIPVLLGFGVLEVYGRYYGRMDSLGRAGVVLTAIGLAFVFLAVLLYAVIPPGLVAVIIVGVPGVTGVAVLAVGSALLAAGLYRLGFLGLPASLLLGLGVPLTPFVGAAFALLGTPAPLVTVAPAGIVGGLSAIPYGLGWMLFGYRLWQTAGVAPGRLLARSSGGSVSPQAVVAGLVGGAFVLFSVGRFVPLGPLSGTPWVGQSLVLDLGHLGVGLAGMGVAASRTPSLARFYNRAVGLLSLALVVVTLVGVFQDLRGLRWLLVGVLDLNLPDVILHLPVAVLLLAVGILDRDSAGSDETTPYGDSA